MVQDGKKNDSDDKKLSEIESKSEDKELPEKQDLVEKDEKTVEQKETVADPATETKETVTDTAATETNDTPAEDKVVEQEASPDSSKAEDTKPVDIKPAGQTEIQKTEDNLEPQPMDVDAKTESPRKSDVEGTKSEQARTDEEEISRAIEKCDVKPKIFSAASGQSQAEDSTTTGLSMAEKLPYLSSLLNFIKKDKEVSPAGCSESTQGVKSPPKPSTAGEVIKSPTKPSTAGEGIKSPPKPSTAGEKRSPGETESPSKAKTRRESNDDLEGAGENAGGEDSGEAAPSPRRSTRLSK
jgi:hypothetical protein